MRKMNETNQLRANYEIYYITYKNWFFILFWLLNAVIVNVYHFQYIYWQQQEIFKHQLFTQLNFWEKLYQDLFNFDDFLYEKLFSQRLNQTLSYNWVYYEKSAICMWCRYKKKHKLMRLIIFIVTERFNLSCFSCKMILCLKRECWKKFYTDSISS